MEIKRYKSALLGENNANYSLFVFAKSGEIGQGVKVVTRL